MAMDYAAMNGNLKQIYADQLQDLTFDADAFQKRARFNQRKAVGDAYNQPVKLSNSHGFTYQASDVGIATLNDAITLQTKNSSLKPSQITGAEVISYDVAERASSKGPKAFKAAWGLTVSGLLQGHAQRIDEQCLYGQKGLGTFSASTNVDTTHTTLTMDAAEFAAGIWAGSVNRQLDVYNGATKINTNAVVVVTSVDITAKTVEVSGNTTDISTIDTDSGTTMTLYEVGAYGAEQMGVHAILTTDNKFGIDGATYDLWKGNSYAVGAALSTAKVDEAVAQAVNRGLREDVTLWLNPLKWSSLAQDINSSRRWTGGEARTKVGTTALEYLSQNGRVEVVPYNMIKEGYAFALPMKQVMRIGAVDLSFRNTVVPGGNPNYFFELQSQTGVGIRTRSNQATYVNFPSRASVLTGIA